DGIRDFHVTGVQTCALPIVLAQRENDDTFTLLLREKLAAATVVQEHAMPPDVLTLYSRVRYRVDGLAPTTRILIHDPTHEIIGEIGRASCRERGEMPEGGVA